MSTSAIFDQIIKQYMSAGAASTSATHLTALRSPAVQQITLLSSVGFNPGDKVAVDVDALYEQARVEQVAGNVISLQLTLAHGDLAGTTYPISVEGGEMIVREVLREIALVKLKLSKAASQAGLQQVDEVHWYPGKSGVGGPIDGLMRLLSYWRDELAHTLGVVNLRNIDGSGSSSGSTQPVLY